MTDTTGNVDYAELYDGYWGQSERLGEHSFTDAEAVVTEVLSALGTGRVLDVGCGMGLLVQTLLAHGVDAYGVDVSSVAVERGNRMAPDRFHLGSILALPFADNYFDIVVSTDCLEHLDERDVPRALAELHRVSKRGLYLRLATTADRDGHWHLTVQPRSWWEQQLFAAGFRKHPRALSVVGYERLEHDGWQITLVQERLPTAATQQFPLAKLLETRDLHMDMLRETGRRSDAHIARYFLAADFVRPNDVVLDAACGLGYGSAVLAANSEAQRVIGVDLSGAAIDYATATTGARWPQVEFHPGDATKLATIDDRSVDLVTSFETLEHVPDPEAVLAEFARVLKPAGRVIVSVPNMWVDETGKDPNPHHLHVYDWAKLREQLARQFLPEAVWSQTAGGALKLPRSTRRLVRAELRDPTAVEAEWWLAMAMKSPVDEVVADYRETSFLPAAGSERPHVTAFGRDYDNPWLVKAMVARGQRAIEPALLAMLTAAVLQRQPVGPGAASADVGAALCVHGYQLLADGNLAVTRVDEFVRQVDAYCDAPAANPNALRWQVSLHFVAASLLRKCGRRELAGERFRRCAAIDVSAYSPILGTKTVDALLQAGLIALADGAVDDARRDWQQAMNAAERLLRRDWSTFVGDREQPLAFGLREATDLLDLTARAARGLLDLPTVGQRPGKSWDLMRFGLRPNIELLERAIADLRSWNEQMLDQTRSPSDAYSDLMDRYNEVVRAREVEQAQIDQLRTQVDAQQAELAARRVAMAEQERLLADRDEEIAQQRLAISHHQQHVADLERMRGIKGTIRGLVDRLRK